MLAATEAVRLCRLTRRRRTTAPRSRTTPDDERAPWGLRDGSPHLGEHVVHPKSLRLVALAQLVLKQRKALSEDRVLIAQLRDHGRVVQQHDDREQEPDRRRRRRRRIAGIRPSRRSCSGRRARRRARAGRSRSGATAARTARGAGGSESARRRLPAAARTQSRQRLRRQGGSMVLLQRDDIAAEEADEDRQQHLCHVVDGLARP